MIDEIGYINLANKFYARQEIIININILYFSCRNKGMLNNVCFDMNCLNFYLAQCASSTSVMLQIHIYDANSKKTFL